MRIISQNKWKIRLGFTQFTEKKTKKLIRRDRRPGPLFRESGRFFDFVDKINFGFRPLTLIILWYK